MNLHSPIEHIIVLMFENRSFDHILGYLPNGGELTGDEFCLVDPLDQSSEKVCVSSQADYLTPISPSHDFENVHLQLFGDPARFLDPAPMNGFIKAAIQDVKGDVETGKKIMECFDPAKLPALTALAREFCLCTRWFSSIPGPTWPNRFFIHCATSDGMVTNDVEHPFEMKTIYDSLEEAGLTWSLYCGDFPQSLALRRLWGKLERIKGFERFHSDVENGDLPEYSFIEPRYINFLLWKANDEHPPHNLELGEYLITEVYDTLRNSSYWEKSLLVVLYDEHGGFYDHVSPPCSAPNPDGKTSANPAFDFTRLGLRVPAVIVSPFINKGTIDSRIYEHSSIPATIKKVFGLPEFLTARDAWANPCDLNLERSTPREDAPLTLPVPGSPASAGYHRALMRSGARKVDVLGAVERAEHSMEPLSEFQDSLVGLASRIEAGLLGEAYSQPGLLAVEHEAADYIYESLRRLKRHSD